MLIACERHTSYYVMTTDYWETIHAYRRLQDAGRLSPILCPDDQVELLPVINKKNADLPSLKCLVCGTVFKPGLDVWDQIISNVREATLTVKEQTYERA